METYLKVALTCALLLIAPRIANCEPVVVGPGSAIMSLPAGICRWSDMPGCSFEFRVENTSTDALVMMLDLPDGYWISEFHCAIAPGAWQDIQVGWLTGNLTAVQFRDATTIYTSTPVPEPMSLILLGSGLLAVWRRRGRSV